jgi:hypothetical protein
MAPLGAAKQGQLADALKNRRKSGPGAMHMVRYASRKGSRSTGALRWGRVRASQCPSGLVF